MSTQPPMYLTAEAYLAFEETSPIKHEYYGGVLLYLLAAMKHTQLFAVTLTQACTVKFASDRVLCTPAI